MQKADRQINYKKRRSYQEFLYILPFLILVGIFSYFPLYGWIYAFHDYEPPYPITSETFVGFKWFGYLFSNSVRINDVIRVLRNTFAMSGISLFFSWFPMVFAVFLKALVSNSSTTTNVGAMLATAATATSIRMTVTVVVVLPVMLVYPFFQRFFTKGIMIGAVKG